MPITWLSGGGGEVFSSDGIGVLDVEHPGYGMQALQLLPHGPAWSRRPGSMTHDLTVALARSFARVHTAQDRLRREIFPDTADEMLPRWERFAGITDPPAELEDRQALVTTKLFRSRGPLTPESTQAIALELGYESATWVRLYRPFKCGSKAGAKLAGSGTVAWQWHVLIAVSPSIPEFNDRLVALFREACLDHLTLHVRFDP